VRIVTGTTPTTATTTTTVFELSAASPALSHCGEYLPELIPEPVDGNPSGVK